jgi:hypothetical protein
MDVLFTEFENEERDEAEHESFIPIVGLGHVALQWSVHVRSDQIKVTNSICFTNAQQQ